MKNFLNFLNRHFAKILWTAAILVWMGVGIYYFSTNEVSLNLRSLIPLGPSVTPTTIPATSENYDDVESITGNFNTWEEIESCPDRYIVLTNPESGKDFPKIRIGFEESILFGAGEREDATVFAVTKDGENYEVLGYFKDFSFEEIAKLIKKGDYVKVVLKKKIIEETDEPLQYVSTKNAKDEAGNLLAHWFFIKRTGGKQEIEQELGRKLKSYE